MTTLKYTLKSGGTQEVQFENKDAAIRVLWFAVAMISASKRDNFPCDILEAEIIS